MKLITPIFIIFHAIILFSCNLGSIESEKELAWNQYYKGEYQMVDTLMSFVLSEDSITIDFFKPTQLKKWLGALSIYDSNESVFHSDSNNDKILDTLEVNEGRITIKGLKLDPNRLSEYDVFFEGGPIFEGKEILAIPFYYNSNLFIEKTDGYLTPQRDLRKAQFHLFDNQILFELNSDLKEYCKSKRLVFMEKSLTEWRIDAEMVEEHAQCEVFTTSNQFSIKNQFLSSGKQLC